MKPRFLKLYRWAVNIGNKFMHDGTCYGYRATIPDKSST